MAKRRATDGQLVVIGSSAGGIEALSRVVASLPSDFPAPIVIAQHLDPRRPSHLAEILARHATLPIKVVENAAALEDGVIFVVPSNRLVAIVADELRLRPARPRSVAPSVDLLLETAAAAFGPRLIAVILTGSGSDGSSGALQVKEAGGAVIIENPETALFPSMPRSISPSIVDATADVDSIGAVLRDMLAAGVAAPAGRERREFAAVLDRIRERSGIDFSTYKTATIVRRLRGRMSATGHPSLADYGKLIETDAEEYARLVSSLLIKVTEFFRDPKVFQYLREETLPTLIAEARRRDRQLRVWSAGCSTGEEAYSLAITLVEALRDDPGPLDVRVFATDIDRASIAFARRGLYPPAALKNVSPTLRARYFVKSDGGYEVARTLRSLMIFGEHDLGARAPFPRIDLILCRNVLIYFNLAMQRAALETFGLSLRDDGRLVLGLSETVAAMPDAYVEDQARLRIYRRLPGLPLAPLARANPVRPNRALSQSLDAAISSTRRDAQVATDSTEEAEAILLDLRLGIVVVDVRYYITRINTAARRMLGIHGLAFGQDFIHLAEVLPSTEIRAAIDAAFDGKTTTTLHEIEASDVSVEGPGFLETVVRPHVRQAGASEAPGAIIELTDMSRGERDRLASKGTDRRLERATIVNERLRRANEELTTLVAQVRLANQAMLLSSEEAQAGREEVETLNEEFQATNEELETLNEELTASVEELRVANEDLAARTDELRLQTVALEEQKQQGDEQHNRLESVLTSLGDAVLAVDHAGRTVATNPAYDRIFGGPDAEIRPEDVAGLPLPEAERPQHRAARGERFRMEFAVSEPDGMRRWFEAVTEPLTREDRTWGGVIAIRDVSERTMRRSLERLMAAAGHELKTPTAAIHNYLQLVDRHLAAGDAEKAGTYARRALTQTQKLATLIERLLDVSRIQGGLLELVLERVDLAVVVRSAVEVAQVLPKAPPIRLTIASRPVPVRADAGRLEQVLLNLLANAIEHAPASRTVDVALRIVDDRAEVSVRDHGPGVKATDVRKMFDAYTRLGQPHRAAGLGLGLYVAREIVIAHGGEIDAESRVGRGTVVTVRLPLATGRARAAVTARDGGTISSPKPGR
ncbi:MAG TPA: CheR family methyltransferase [Candidatus Limnocylindrales bacterium]|nr:CheR family methyltransferase [Candidatus Limnocylindrales bacterium]